jgi:cytochrome oxidase Cu insertion factor (SCO1/SenC/PrrC family)
MRRRLLLALPLTCLALLAIVVALVGLTGGVRSPAHPPALAGGERPLGIPVHAFALRDEHGRLVRLSDFRGHPVALLFVRTNSPTASPLAADSVRSALDQVPAARAVAVSTAPRADTASARRRFLAGEKLGGRMPYLSGSPAAVGRVRRAYAEPAQTIAVVVLDPTGRQRSGFNITELTPEGLAHDLRAVGR